MGGEETEEWSPDPLLGWSTCRLCPALPRRRGLSFKGTPAPLLCPGLENVVLPSLVVELWSDAQAQHLSNGGKYSTPRELRDANSHCLLSAGASQQGWRPQVPPKGLSCNRSVTNNPSHLGWWLAIVSEYVYIHHFPRSSLSGRWPPGILDWESPSALFPSPTRVPWPPVSPSCLLSTLQQK